MNTSLPEESCPVPTRGVCLDFYRQMARLRQFELAAQKHYKAGRMPGFIHLYIGEEACATGVCAHLRKEDWITSTHRGHGHALAKGTPANALMAELYGRKTGCCGGRGGSMHLFDTRRGLLGTNGIVAGGLPAAVGAAISSRARGTDAVVAAFFGDGAVNHGSFHESVNLAAIQRAPVIFVCENNLYATATPFHCATRNTSVASRAAAYGLPGVEVDGNDVIAVWEAAGRAIAGARRGEGPTLLELKTYRFAGHHEGDPVTGAYRSQEELDRWKQRCPLAVLRQRLLAEGLAEASEFDAIDQQAQAEMAEAVLFAESSPPPDPATARSHVLADPINPAAALDPRAAPGAPTSVTNYLDAVRDGIAEEMRKNPHLLYLGEGIGERGGSFAHTKGLWKEFGGERVIDTPISELGFSGAAAGASATGCRTVADMMFVDFLFDASSQLLLQAAKWRYMSNGQVSAPVVFRASMGSIKSSGPHHSGCFYTTYAQHPGLIVAVPSNAADAKGLMKTALQASDPVLFLEHKLLFGTKWPVPEGEYYVPFGRANVLRPGRDLTLVSCGDCVNRCLLAAQELEKQGVDCEVIDLRTVVPLDIETILTSVARTGRLLVADEAAAMCGLGAEIAQTVLERAFDELDAPVGRIHPDAVSQPFSPGLEQEISVTTARIVQAAKAVVEGRPLAPFRLTVPHAPTAATPAPPISPSPVLDPPGTPAPTPPGIAKTPAAGVAPGLPILMPNQDLTVTEGVVVRWLKQPGDTVISGEILAEVETAKAVVPVESPGAGVLAEILAAEGATVLLGASLGTVHPESRGPA